MRKVDARNEQTEGVHGKTILNFNPSIKMILSFKKQFKQPIVDGTKIHTIREDTPNRWKAGDKIHFATGVRTKNYECFKEGECKLVQRIEIKHHHTFVEIKIDGNPYGEIQTNKIQYQLALADMYNILTFIRNDGFSRVDDFLAFFHTDFTGKIIHWTDLTY